MGNPLNIKYAIPEPFTTIPQKLNRRSLLLKTQTGRQTRQHWQTSESLAVGAFWCPFPF